MASATTTYATFVTDRDGTSADTGAFLPPKHRCHLNPVDETRTLEAARSVCTRLMQLGWQVKEIAWACGYKTHSAISNLLGTAALLPHRRALRELSRLGQHVGCYDLLYVQMLPDLVVTALPEGYEPDGCLDEENALLLRHAGLVATGMGDAVDLTRVGLMYVAEQRHAAIAA